MRKCRVLIENVPGSPYSPSRKHDLAMLDREEHDAYDARTWRNHCTVNKDGQTVIPAMAIKQMMDMAAQKLGIKVPGKRGALYKGFFTSGFLVTEDAPIANGKALTPNDAEMVIVSCNPGGRRGGGSRVPRRFPLYTNYNAWIEAIILDDILTQDIVMTHFNASGIIVGLGRFRPENGGYNGRFRVKDSEWENVEF